MEISNQKRKKTVIEWLQKNKFNVISAHFQASRFAMTLSFLYTNVTRMLRVICVSCKALNVFLDSVAIFYVPQTIVLLYRGGFFSIVCNTLSLTICNAHREGLGLQWRRNKSTCCHSDHNVNSRAKPDQGATPTLCKEYRYWLQFQLTNETHNTCWIGSGKSKQYLILKSCP